MRIQSSFTLLALASSIATSVACGGAPGGGAGNDQAGGETGDDAGAVDAGAVDPSHGATDSVVTLVTPAGVQCVVATVSGADSETVTAAVASGASSASLNFGSLAPGVITVSANAYTTACPGSGAPAWVSEPTQFTVVAGVPAPINIVLRPNTQTSGTASFSLPAIAIAVGPRTSYAVLSDGSVHAWGANEAGEFGTLWQGITPFTSSSTPFAVSGVTTATQLAAGDGFACAIHGDSTVTCWGNNQGQIAGAPLGVTASVSITNLYSGQLSAGAGNLAFLGAVAPGTSGASVGDIGADESCNAGFNCPPSGIQWGPSGAANAISVAVGTTLTGGTVGLCWVTREGGALCNWLASQTWAGAATHVFAGADGATPTSPNFACAVLASGGVDCWGANASGELGIGSTTAATAPVSVPGLHNVTSMGLSRGTSGGAFSCAVSGGAVLCAGANQDGQLGNGTNVPSTSYVPTVGLTGIVAVAVGQSHACALDAEGAVHCWGDNDDGELGDGTQTTRFSPVTVAPW